MMQYPLFNLIEMEEDAQNIGKYPPSILIVVPADYRILYCIEYYFNKEMFIGMLDEIKKQKEEERIKRQRELDHDIKRREEENKLISDKLLSYIPLVEEYCKESGFRYSLRYDNFPGTGRIGHYILITGKGKEANLLLCVNLAKSGFWGGKKLFTSVHATTYTTSYDFHKAQKNASVEWLKNCLLEFYENRDRYR